MSSEKLANLLNPCENGDLSRIVRRAEALGELTETLSKSLPGDMAPALVAANIRDSGELVVIARSPAWAARLRFESENLLAAARANGHDVSALRVRVSHDAE